MPPPPPPTTTTTKTKTETKTTVAAAEQEDVHFPRCIEARGGRIASADEQDAFATYGSGGGSGGSERNEEAPIAPSLGVHKLDTSNKHVRSFVEEACPEWRLVV